ncbi:MAG TPA: GAF domain-containing protein [Anaerolineales bacterium]|nr:GAF domain-containing protein [Anaerolineales bacterium]
MNNSEPNPGDRPMVTDLSMDAAGDRRDAAPGRSSMSLQARLTLSFALVVIVAVGLVTLIFYLVVRQQLRQDIKDLLLDAVAIASLQIDGDLHATLLDPSQEGGPEYTQIRQVMQSIRDAGQDFRFVYTMRVGAGQAVFVVDAEDNPDDISHLGDVYDDINPELLPRLSRITGPIVEEEFYTDQWGTFLSGYAPVYASDGRVECVLGIDILADDVLAQERQILSIALLIFAFMIPASFLLGWVLSVMITGPMRELIEGAQRITGGDFTGRLAVRARDEFGLLAEVLNALSDRVRQDILNLETRVADRTREMDQRSTYLRAAGEVGYAVTSILNADRLIQQVVDLIRERFSLYYVGLFMVDAANEWADLRAGTGEAGKKMLAQGHRIKVGEGMVGWAVLNSQARVALEVEQDAVRLATSDLPDTRSEAALPLRSRGRVIGALTVQSTHPGIFDAEFISLLQTMADQVAVALDNANLFAESEDAIQALRRSYGELSRKAWVDAIRLRRTAGYIGDATGVRPLHAHSPVSQAQAAEGTSSTLSLPIKVRDQLLGYIEARKPQASEWSKDEQSLMETLIDQLGVALENARLYEDTQKRAEQERLLSDITAKVRSSTDINLILQTAMQELAEALRIPRGAIQLRRTETQQAAREKPKGAKPVDGASSSANNVAPASTMQGDDVHA